MSRFPDHFPPDTTIEDVDLDQEEVVVGGQRLTEARAAELAAQTLREIRIRNLVPGRKSLSGEGTHSPVIQFRVPVHLREAVEARAQADEVSVSVVARRALESYLAEPSVDESGQGGGEGASEPKPVPGQHEVSPEEHERLLGRVWELLDSLGTEPFEKARETETLTEVWTLLEKVGPSPLPVRVGDGGFEAFGVLTGKASFFNQVEVNFPFPRLPGDVRVLGLSVPHPADEHAATRIGREAALLLFRRESTDEPVR
jgi:hypothetical protein